jgi:hypothetical protein
VNIDFLYRSVTGKNIPATLPRIFKYKEVKMGTHIVYAQAVDLQQDVADENNPTRNLTSLGTVSRIRPSSSDVCPCFLE